ncbi:MAG: DUF3099 domain-containing protein [Rothia sp. (in: high G+C Gram-positive bacteria)]|nr:DUF3099 domain-containing protein [Rothia sp. (in: high G+C Gram-positive bacteria)]
MAQKFWTAEDLKKAGYSSDEPEIFEITAASERQSAGVSSRAKAYAFKMFLRLVFIIAAVMVDGFWQWICLGVAAIIPWMAVTVANGDTPQGSKGFSSMLPPEQQAAIEAAQADRAARTASYNSADATNQSKDDKTASAWPTDAKGGPAGEPVMIEGDVLWGTEDGKEQ